jgi:hypothetical protein
MRFDETDKERDRSEFKRVALHSLRLVVIGISYDHISVSSAAAVKLSSCIVCASQEQLRVFKMPYRYVGSGLAARC